MAARTEMRQAPGGRGGKKDPNGLTLGVTGLSFSCMDLVDPKRDFLLTLNESAQSKIAACIPSPPPPPPHLKKIWGDWGEKGDLGACITGVIVFFFSAGGGRWGMPKPAIPWQLVKNRNTAVGRKNFSESTCCRNVDFRETRQCDVL